MFGATQTNTLTPFGGSLLTDPVAFIPINQLPPAGASLALKIPNDQALCGVSAYAQHIHTDPGASARIAFSPGLELVFGR